MVTVNFKLSDKGTMKLDVSKPESFTSILERCVTCPEREVGAFIAVRDNRVIAGEDIILDFDEIDVFPALSGG